MSQDIPVRTLLLTVFDSIIEVFLLCLAGYVLSRAGVTDKATQRKLNVINVSLFTPALLFSKVAYSLTPSKLKEMWIIPLGFVVVTGLSAAVAWTLSKIFKLSRSQTSFAICAAMFQNSNSLPIALIQSLVIEVPGLKWGKDDTKDSMLGRALTYLVLYSTLGMMLRWSWGVKLLSRADDDEVPLDGAVAEAGGAGVGQGAGQVVQSPDALGNGGEASPFFPPEDQAHPDSHALSQSPTSTTHGLTHPQPRGSSFGVAPTTIREPSPSPPPSPQPNLPFTAPGSAHSMHPAARRISVDPAVSAISSSGASPRSPRSISLDRGEPGAGGRMTRRDSAMSHMSHMSHRKQRAPSRTDSGREFWGLPDPPKESRIELIEEDSSDEEAEEEWGNLSQPLLRRRTAPTTRWQTFLATVKPKAKAWGKSVNAFMTVPMYAALLSIFIAMVPPIQREMAKVKPLEQAIKSAGQCSIPVTLVVLGAFFYAPPEPTPTSIELPTSTSTSPTRPTGNYFERKLRALAPGSALSGAKPYPRENRTVFVAVISRMVIVPLLMMPVLAVIAKWDLFEAAADPVFVLSAVLLVSSPPALTLAQITQAASGDAFERLISKTISWSYAVLTPPLTLVYVVIGLVFGKM
ncbi:hypothetical protein IAT38_006009 [Cryptococcus sp. DSM 104549]